MKELHIYADWSKQKNSWFHDFDADDEFTAIDADEDEVERREKEIVNNILSELNEAAEHVGKASEAMWDANADIVIELQSRVNTADYMSSSCDAALAALMLIIQDTPAKVSFRTEYEQWRCVAYLFKTIIGTLEIQPYLISKAKDAASHYNYYDRCQAIVEFMNAYASQAERERRNIIERRNVSRGKCPAAKEG